MIIFVLAGASIGASIGAAIGKKYLHGTGIAVKTESSLPETKAKTVPKNDHEKSADSTDNIGSVRTDSRGDSESPTSEPELKNDE